MRVLFERARGKSVVSPGDVVIPKSGKIALDDTRRLAQAIMRHVMGWAPCVPYRSRVPAKAAILAELVRRFRGQAYTADPHSSNPNFRDERGSTVAEIQPSQYLVAE